MNQYNNNFSQRNLPLFAKLAFFCLLLIPTFAFSQERVLAVMSGNGKIYQDFLFSLKKNLDKDTAVSKTIYSEIDNKSLNNYSFIVSIGYKAAKVISKHKANSNVIYSLIPDNELLQGKLPCKKTTCYKIYINQPVYRYVKLFKILFPKGKKLAFATTKEKSKKLHQVKISAKKNSLSYKNIHIQKNKNISRILINDLNSNDVLLALPNPEIYNANNAKSIILSTYHVNVPIIAYSKSFAKAGALISLYSSTENIAEKTAGIINAIITDGPRKQKEYYADNFTIEINDAVARSMNIKIDSKSIIKRNFK